MPKKTNKKTGMNKAILIFACTFLALVLAFTVVLGSISIAKNVKAVVSYEGVTLELEAEEYLGTGDTIKYTYKDNVVGEFIALVRGDVTGDGVVASDDLLLMRRYILELNEFNETQELAGDLTGEGISSANVLMMRRYILGLEEAL